MKSRYFLVNKKEREEFEKKWHAPYGFSDAPVTLNPAEASSWLDLITELEDNPEDWVILKLDDSGAEEIFRSVVEIIL